MNICIITSTIDKSYGGPARSVPILAKGLAQNGVNTTLLTQESANMNTHLLDESNVKLVTVPRRKFNVDVKNIIINGNFDVLHLQNLWDPFIHKMAKLARKLNIPYIMTPRGMLEPWSLQQKKWKKKIALAIYQKEDLRKAACILATSHMEAIHIRDLGIKAPIAVIPNGIDVSEYSCRALSDRDSVKKQIVFLSRIHQKKGIELLIQAWERIYEKYPEWNIVIAGNGDESYIRSLGELIKSKPIEKSMKIVPPVFGNDKMRLYYESSIFVLPTYSENFGMVIAEAMSCGVPAITTNGTPWQELNELGIGWCIDLSVDNLTKALSDAIALGTDALFDMGQNASLHITDNYQYTQVAKKNISVYEWIINQGEKPKYIE